MNLSLKQARLLSEDYGKHLMGVEDLLQKHSLLEADIGVVGERVKSVNSNAEKYVDGEFPDIGGKLQHILSIQTFLLTKNYHTEYLKSYYFIHFTVFIAFRLQAM